MPFRDGDELKMDDNENDQINQTNNQNKVNNPSMVQQGNSCFTSISDCFKARPSSSTTSPNRKRTYKR